MNNAMLLLPPHRVRRSELRSETVLEGVQIGMVSQATGLSIDTIRFYQRIGLLRAPVRSAGGFRLFSSEEIQDLHFIAKVQNLGFSLEEIKHLLSLRKNTAFGCREVRDLIRAKIKDVRSKIQALQVLQAELSDTLEKCNRALKTNRDGDPCPVLDDLRRADM